MSDVHAKAKKGIKLLLGRQVLLQVFTFGGGVLLARILTPSQFGLYGIATFLVSFLALVGDFGLSPSFIQRKEELTELDLKVGFTLQQILTTVVVGVLLFSAPWLAHFYPKAPPETVWLVRAMAFSLYLTAWRSMSALQLERHLRYDRLAMIEVVETIVFQGTAVILAITGHGVWSLVWATMARGVIGTILIFIASPWPIRLAYDYQIAKGILQFGIPFQLQTIFNSAASWVTPTLVGSMIGPQAVGYLTWASSNGKKPMMLVSNVMQVSFPHFSRLQDDFAEVERILLRYLTLLLLPSGIWFAILCVSGRPLVELIYSHKWTPAVPALIFYAMSLQADVISLGATVTLSALGKVAFTARIYAVRSIAGILLTIPLVLIFGFNAVPLVYMLVIALSNVWLLSGLGWDTTRRLGCSLYWLIFPAAISVLLGEGGIHLFSSTLLQALSGTVVVIIAYCATLLMTGPKWIKQMLQVHLNKQLFLFTRNSLKVSR